MTSDTSDTTETFLAVKDVLSLTSAAVKTLYDDTRARDGCNFSALTPPDAFWTEKDFDESEIALGMRACLAMWNLTSGARVPRAFQLEATIRLMSESESGTDGLLNVGTGKGKTYCLILPCLLDPSSVTLVISPLRALEKQQLATFTEHGIKAIMINSETEHSEETWKACFIVPSVSLES